MKAIKKIVTTSFIQSIIFYALLLTAISLMCSCSVGHKMVKVSYNGHETTRGYIGY